MKSDEGSGGQGWVKNLLLVLVIFGTGLGVGKFVLGQFGTESKVWQTTDELHQMYSTPDGFNVVESNKSSEMELLGLLHGGLYVYDPVQNRLVTDLAKSHEVSEDGKTWTFHLRQAETPDGTHLTAEDVVFSFNLCLDTRFDCKRRSNLILGDKPIVPQVKGPRTVAFTLPEAYPSFLWAISNILIVPKSVYEPIVESVESFRKAVGVEQPELKYLAGFGPYSVAKLDTQEIHLARNERFWGRGDEQDPKPYLKQIVLSLRKAGSTLEMDFRNNDRYPYRYVGPGEAGRLREDNQFMVLDPGRGGWCMFFWLNQNPRVPWAKKYPDRLALFQKLEFRRAFASVIDRDEIIRRAYKGFADPLYGPVSPVYSWAAQSEILKEKTPPLDGQSALELLAGLGVVPGEPGEDGKRWLTYIEQGRRVPLEIEIRTSQSGEDVRKKTAEVIAEQLGKIGVRVNIVEEAFGTMVQRLDQTFDYEAAIMALEGSPNAAIMRSVFDSTGGMHFTNPRQQTPATKWEADVDRQFKVFATSMDPVIQHKALVEMQATWVEAQPAFHLVNERKLVAVRRDYEINGLALTGRAVDPVLTRTVIENVRLRRLVPK